MEREQRALVPHYLASVKKENSMYLSLVNLFSNKYDYVTEMLTNRRAGYEITEKLKELVLNKTRLQQNRVFWMKRKTSGMMRLEKCR